MKKFTLVFALVFATFISLSAQRGGQHGNHHGSHHSGHHNNHNNHHSGHNNHHSGHHNTHHNHHSGHNNHHYGHHNTHNYSHNNHHGHYNTHHNHYNRGHNHGYYNGWSPVCTSDFNAGCGRIRGCSFDSDRLRYARNFASHHYLTVRQIRCIMDMFSFESSRLAFARYAYGRTCDRNNYYQLYNCFSFSSSRRNLELYINGY